MDVPESVAEHCYSMTTIAMVLSDIQNLDTNKIIKMSLLHDLAESIIGDLTSDEISKKEKKLLENKTMEQIFTNLPSSLSNNYLRLWKEYTNYKTKESVFLHEIDKLEMAIQAKIYQNGGISKQKIKPFLNTAKKEIKSKYLHDVLNKFLQQL